MHQWLYRRVDVEVAGLPPKQEIFDEGRAVSDISSQRFELVGKEHFPAVAIAKDHSDNEGRKDPSDAGRIKGRKEENVIFQAPKDDCRDQKTGDNEKDVDPDKAAHEYIRKSMKADHTQDRYGSHSIDIGAIGWPHSS
jgi:hypothetical protein